MNFVFELKLTLYTSCHSDWESWTGRRVSANRRMAESSWLAEYDLHMTHRSHLH
jgi:hypothetical protein